MIAIQNMTKVYGMGDAEVHALGGVSLEIAKGEWVAITGPSGSGKSTLMHIIGCLDSPTAGEYWLNSVEVSGMDDTQLASVRNREIGFVFQSFNLLSRVNALQQVMLPLQYQRGDKRLPIFASAPSIDADEIARQGKALSRIAEHVIIAVPLVEDAVPAIRRLSSDGVRVAATLVHSVAQGLLAAKAGATHVVVAVDALEAIGHPADAVIGGLRAVLDRSSLECDVVAAGAPSATRFAELAAAGADAAVVTPAALRSFLQHPLTDRGIDRFLGDISRRAKPRRTK